MSFADPKISGNVTVSVEDLESGRGIPETTFTSTQNNGRRPMLGRRRTSNLKREANLAASESRLDDEQDTLTKLGDFCWKIHSSSVFTRFAMYILPVSIALAIPLILFCTVYADGHSLERGIFVWVEMLWIGLWVCKLVAKAVPWVFQALCGLISSGVRKYTCVLQELEIPLSLVLWSIMAFASVRVIGDIDAGANDTSWLTDVQTAFKATIVVACIFLAEKTLIQLISIEYHRKQYHHKIKESKQLVRMLDHLYEASRTLFPEFCREFREDDEEIQGASLKDVRDTLVKAGMTSQLINDAGRVRDKATAAIGAMVSDVTGRELMNATSSHTVVLEALETEHASKALARRIWLSLVAEANTALYRSDIVEVLGESMSETADEIFAVLDRDGNGDVSLEEMTMLTVSVGEERRNRSVSMHDISQALSVLDRFLTIFVLLATAFVYASMFSESFANRTASIWGTFTGLGFAIGGTVTEFLSCIIFVFVKHAYSVGDRVTIENVDLICTRISLMYSVFKRVDSGKVVQLPHAMANNLWIENVSRSKAMKESLTLSVAATTSNEDILALRDELQKFVTAEENRRDFQPTFDIELLSVGNMQQLDLKVEIRHKSNWSNELLRSTRRNKFMCALLDATRRIPIDPPGGSALPLGDPGNPAYSVAVSDKEATTSRERHAAETSAKRLFPVGGSVLASIPEGISSAFQDPAKVMIASISGRRGSEVVQGARRSTESMRISPDPRSGSIHGPVTFTPHAL